MTNRSVAHGIPRAWLPSPWLPALLIALLGWASTAVAQSEAQAAAAAQPSSTGAGPASVARAGPLRVLSWNVSTDAFVKNPAAFRALVRKAGADVLLLDEVAPSASERELREALAGLGGVDGDDWHIDFGRSGGRQRNVIASRLPLESLQEFAEIVPYPEADKHRLLRRMRAVEPRTPAIVMDSGIAVNGAVVLDGPRRLLVVSIDLQCCGNDPASWEEDRRQVEVTQIRQLVSKVLTRTSVDGVMLAGDFNLVSTALPLLIASGPYPAPHRGLIAAELYHPGSQVSWTWNGQGTEFPSRAMDFLLYSPQSLALESGYILDTADLPRAELEQLGLVRGSVHMLSDHRPLVAEFHWR